MRHLPRSPRTLLWRVIGPCAALVFGTVLLQALPQLIEPWAVLFMVVVSVLVAVMVGARIYNRVYRRW